MGQCKLVSTKFPLKLPFATQYDSMQKKLDVYCLETTIYINIKNTLLFRYTHLPLHTQYATVERDGERYMTHKDFVCRYLQLTDPSCNQDTIRLLADVADTAKNKWERKSTQQDRRLGAQPSGWSVCLLVASWAGGLSSERGWGAMTSSWRSLPLTLPWLYSNPELWM